MYGQGQHDSMSTCKGLMANLQQHLLAGKGLPPQPLVQCLLGPCMFGSILSCCSMPYWRFISECAPLHDHPFTSHWHLAYLLLRQADRT